MTALSDKKPRTLLNESQKENIKLCGFPYGEPKKIEGLTLGELGRMIRKWDTFRLGVDG